MGKKLSLRHFETIHAVILTGSVTGAASRLHVTQPAISNLLRDAEERIGFALFDRRGGRLMPTPLADMLFEEIERSFTSLNDINAFCDRIHSTQRTQLRVACTPVFGATVFPHFAKTCDKLIGPLFYEVRSAPAHHVAALVNSRKADIGFALDVPPMPGVDSCVLVSVPLYCYIPVDHALAKLEQITVEDLQGQPFISLSQLEGISDIVGQAFSHLNYPPYPVAECPAAITACSMVAGGLGFTLFDLLPSLLFHPTQVVVRPFKSDRQITYKAYWLHARSEINHELMVNAARESFNEVMHRLSVVP